MIKNYQDKEKDQEILFNELWSKYPKLVEAKSVLQVGGRGASCLDTFGKLRNKGIIYCTLMEVWPQNIQKLKNEKSINEFILGNVVNIDTRIASSFDVIFAWHVLEHLEKNEVYETINKMKNKCNALVVGLPWGKWDQDELYGNPYEKHLSHWYPEELQELGFDVFTFGKQPDNHDVMAGILEIVK